MKHSYQTRRLLATRDLRHDGQNVVAGGEVFATETDAVYLTRMGHARDPEESAAAPAADASAPRRGRGPAKMKAPAADKPLDVLMTSAEGTPGADAADGAGGSGDQTAG